MSTLPRRAHRRHGDTTRWAIVPPPPRKVLPSVGRNAAEAQRVLGLRASRPPTPRQAALLDALAAAGRPMTARELSRALGWATSATGPLLNLQAKGRVRHLSDGLWALDVQSDRSTT
jgi:hypothetical protein